MSIPIDEFKLGVVTDISSQTDPNTIPPVTVGDKFLELADIVDTIVTTGGTKGDKGDKGDQGDPGATGATGATGAQGEKGDKGDTGAQGVQGIQGEQGERGEAGIDGLTGDPGTDGLPGATGAKGDDGVAYREGVTYSALNLNFVYDSMTMLLIYTLTPAQQAQFKYDGNINKFLTVKIREKYADTRYRYRNSFDPIVMDNGTYYTSVEIEGVDGDAVTRLQLILSQ